MTGASIERRADEVMTELALPPEDRAAIIEQALFALDAVATLDELPLDTVEPAAIYRLAAEAAPSAERE